MTLKRIVRMLELLEIVVVCFVCGLLPMLLIGSVVPISLVDSVLKQGALITVAVVAFLAITIGGVLILILRLLTKSSLYDVLQPLIKRYGRNKAASLSKRRTTTGQYPTIK